MNVLEMFKMSKKEPSDPPPLPVHWFETSDSVSHRFQFDPDGQFSVSVVDDARSASRRVVESFLNKFFPSGYPYSVNEGYHRYTQFRALQHFSSATLSVLSTQGCIFSYLFPSSHFSLLQACDPHRHRLRLLVGY